MSHVAQCNTVYRRLEDVAAAAKRLGGELLINEKKLRWYASGFVDDSTMWRSMFPQAEADRIAAMPRDKRIKIINDMMNNVDHVVRFPGIGYDVGVYKQPDGTFRLRWDGYNSQLNGKMGGYSGGHFAQAYGIEAAKRAARRKGLRTVEKARADGSVDLEVLFR